MQTVKKGSKGSDVSALQAKLNAVGNYGLIVDGVFGAKTDTALRDFQKKNGLSVDGIAGPKTWSKLGYPTSETPQTRPITEIIVHCSATPEGKDYSSATISSWHQAEKFSSYIDPKTGKIMYVGYHYLIHPDGTIEACRPENVRGCHVVNHNANSIGVCIIGGVASDGKTPKDTRTPQQKASLLKFLKELKSRYMAAKIYGHRDFAAKACPSFDAKNEYAHL